MPSSTRRICVTLVCVLALLAGLIVAGGAADARTPKAARHFSASIEDLAAYVGQTSCDPHIKTGTRKLGNLLSRTYPGIYWGSTYACGTDGSQSEHYEGRAIDWMASVSSKWQHHDAVTFIKWLLATDRYGNRFAMARRLGVMYVIYDNRMWGAWDGKWENYNGCQAKKMQKAAYANSCHRTHVHISLSWNGARGKTTFWTGRVTQTDWGPCLTKSQRKHHRYAHKWKAPNHNGCGWH